MNPPLLAMYLLFLTSHSFSPFGPVATHGLYLGGEFSKLWRGGSPIFHLRLKGRLWVFGGGGGCTPSSAIIESLTSTELARLRFDAVEDRGIGGCAGGLESIANATVCSMSWAWRDRYLLKSGAGSLSGWKCVRGKARRIFT